MEEKKQNREQPCNYEHFTMDWDGYFEEAIQ